MRTLTRKRPDNQRFESKASNLPQKAIQRAENACKLVNRLESLSISDRGIYNTLRLSHCGALENIYFASELNNCGTGELFDGIGNLYSCNLAYCPNCRVQKSRAHKKRIREGIASIKILVGQRWRFITLTAPPVPHYSLLESLEVINYAWTLFRKRKLFVDAVAGYFKNIEFTVNSETSVPHIHIHSLLLSKWMERENLREVWTDCITQAWSKKGVSLKIKMSDNLCIVDVREVTAKEHHPSLEDAILETGKYAAKGADWMNLSDRDLSEIVSLDRFPRMFEVGGNMSKRERSTFLDKKHLNDGKMSKVAVLVDKIVNYKGLTKVLPLKVRVVRQFRKAQLVGHHPIAVFETLSGDIFRHKKLEAHSKVAVLKLRV